MCFFEIYVPLVIDSVECEMNVVVLDPMICLPFEGQVKPIVWLSRHVAGVYEEGIAVFFSDTLDVACVSDVIQLHLV